MRLFNMLNTNLYLLCSCDLWFSRNGLFGRILIHVCASYPESGKTQLCGSKLIQVHQSRQKKRALVYTLGKSKFGTNQPFSELTLKTRVRPQPISGMSTIAETIKSNSINKNSNFIAKNIRL